MNELEEMLSGVERLADKCTFPKWVYMEKHVDADLDSYIRADQPLDDDDGDEIITDWCVNLQYIAHLNPAFALSLVSKVREMAEELRVTQRALELASDSDICGIDDYLAAARKEVRDGK